MLLRYLSHSIKQIFFCFSQTHTKKPHNDRLTNKTKTIIDIVILPFSSRCSEDLKLPGDEAAGKTRACYNVEFTFDADTQVAITIYYQAIEEFHNGVPVWVRVIFLMK